MQALDAHVDATIVYDVEHMDYTVTGRTLATLCVSRFYDESAARSWVQGFCDAKMDDQGVSCRIRSEVWQS